jgi:hypothetical protein
LDSRRGDEITIKIILNHTPLPGGVFDYRKNMRYYCVDNEQTQEKFDYQFDGDLGAAIMAFFFLALSMWGRTNDEIKIINGGVSRKNGVYSEYRIKEETDWNKLTDPNRITITDQI